MSAPARRLDVAALLDRKLEPMPWRCGELAADGFVTVLTGHAGEGKSWIALALAVGVACGSSPGGIECRKGNALILDAENGEWLLHRRVREVDAPRVNLDLYLSDGLDLSKPADLHWLTQAVTDAGVNLLILDSLRSLAPRMEENNGDSVAPVMAGIRQIARDTGAAVIVLHHRPKNSGSAYRGSSALRDQTDMLYLLGRCDGDPEVKTRLYLRADKMRLAAAPEDLWLQLHYANGRMSLEPADPYGGSSSAPTVKEIIADQIEAHLVANPEGVNRADLARHVKRSRDDGTVRRALDQLDIEGRANRPEHRGNPWTARGVRPPDPRPDQMTLHPDERRVSQATPLGVADLTRHEGAQNGGTE